MQVKEAAAFRQDSSEANEMGSDVDINNIRSNDAAIEWPPRSGRVTHFPEVNSPRGSQRPFLVRLEVLWRT